MKEKEIDVFIAKTLQKKKIDFIRIKNSNFRGGFKNFNTAAFDESFPCDKYVPDFIIARGHRVIMIENGLKIGNSETLANQKRKDNQRMRMYHWEDHGGCDCHVVTSIDEAKKILDNLE